MMSNTLMVYALIFSLCRTHITAQYCDSESKSSMAFNLGRFVFFGGENKAKYIWQFDAKSNSIYAQKLDISDIFTDNSLISVQTSVGFNFIDCKTDDTKSEFCRIVRKARNIVIAMGQKLANPKKVPNAYVSYRMDSEQTPELTQLFDSDMVWGLKSQGLLTEKFWKIPGNASKSITNYQSLVFAQQTNQLLASVHHENKNSLFMKTLSNKTGLWNEWTHVKDISFIGMFCVRGRVFGMDSDNIITEFIWNGNKIEFLKKSDSKEFFNCYQNSTLIIPYIPPVFTTTDNGENSSLSSQQSSTNGLIVTTDASESKSLSSSMIVIIIVVIVIIILIIIIIIAFAIFFLICKRKTKNTKQSSESSRVKPKTSGESVKTMSSTASSTAATIRSNKNLFIDYSMSENKQKSNRNAKRVGSTTSIKTIRSEMG